MYADASKLSEEASGEGLKKLAKISKRIFNIATVGFRTTFGNDEKLSDLFLNILLESNKLSNELYRLMRPS